MMSIVFYILIGFIAIVFLGGLFLAIAFWLIIDNDGFLDD